MEKTTQPWETVRNFATDYLLPVLALLCVVMISLGLLALGGLFFAILFPIALVIGILLLCLYLGADLAWRISVLDGIIGVVGTILAFPGLVNETLATIGGGLLGGAVAALLYLNGDPGPIKQRYEQSLESRTVGDQTYTILKIAEPYLSFNALIGSAAGFVLFLLGWLAPFPGATALVLSFAVGLSLGRSAAWFAVESDQEVFVFWQPWRFLADLPVVNTIFGVLRELRRLVGLSLAHWAVP
ncbi:MAG: hypothetical protein NZ959_00525 [Armatimonadetes bacterium]|nr:hypothetical protein [Armatimonadota bacterium]MDW8120798.1 hypothetical protein [Armatimonadota bacterium]